MSTRRTAIPRPQPDGGRATLDGMRLRFRLSQADAALLSDLQADDETPVDTLRRLIRTAAMVNPILHALREGRAAAAPTAHAAPDKPDDLVERQRAALDAWLQDD